jgi:hypothetical protein
MSVFGFAEFVMNPLKVAWRAWAMDGDRPGCACSAYTHVAFLRIISPAHTPNEAAILIGFESGYLHGNDTRPAHTLEPADEKAEGRACKDRGLQQKVQKIGGIT